MVALLLLASSAEAQVTSDLPALIRHNVSRLADSLFTANGEQWSGQIWSASPDFRVAARSAQQNGFILESLEIDEQGTSVDPAGKELAIVSMHLEGSLLLKEGKIVPVEVERAINVLHDQQMPLAERYPELLRKDSSLWSNVIQPTLVALGAAAIIALFFFVRS
ncbi:MAG TPA: hypothetical protein VFH43_03740 [Candidatus Kapabacteria bacterium]|nr:hypothetical protein [Candidatus Kapabacteria bacterium]